MPVAKQKAKKVSKTAKTTKKTRSTKVVKAAHHSLSWKKVAAIVFLPLFAVALFAIGTAVSYAATQTVVTYNTIPEGDVGIIRGTTFEDYRINEFGSKIALASTERNNTNITVQMTSNACETGAISTSNCSSTPGSHFTHPVTLNVYKAGPDNTVGDRIATVTKAVDVPYRPAGTYCDGFTQSTWGDADGVCRDAQVFSVDFHVDPVEKTEGQVGAGTTIPMPDTVIVTVSFYTQSNTTPGTAADSTNPFSGKPGPYNYLGVSATGAPAPGTSLPTASDAYVTQTPEVTNCQGESGTGELRLDGQECWVGVLPGLRVSSSAADTTPPPVIPPSPTLPKTADECKKDGWKTFTAKFKNQGDCVSSVVSTARAL
jgi:hypothetical protein